MNGSICRTAASVPAVALPGRDRETIGSTLLRALENALLWRERARSRRVLLGMDDRMLSDIGIDRAAARSEGERPFWQA
jgi:uncharacterized protein YjiS (DUF1127 family)